jgi:seryl-tRNA synthetase
MIDIHFFRNFFEELKNGIGLKHFECNLDEMRDLDLRRTEALRAFEAARAEQQRANNDMASIDKHSEAFQKRVGELRVLSERVKTLEMAHRALEVEWKALWLQVPNIPHPSVPVGWSAADNIVVHSWGDIGAVSPLAHPHYDIDGFERGVDFSRGGKVVGSGFPFYRGDLAQLVRALIQFFLEEAIRNGYTELMPPLVVNAESATGTGQLPDKEGMMYPVGDEGYLIPTAEVPVTNFFRDEILEDLPVKLCAYSPCFRREAGSWGKDVRGLNRLHQFDKVELVHFESPEDSIRALDGLRSHAEVLLQKLEIPYRVLLMCTGDMGFPHAKQYDIEVWAGGQKKWLEVSSCSCFTDFQARRLNVRYRDADGKLSFIHTLNGSALAVPRVLIAILENKIREDGCILLPPVLHRWFPEGVVRFR